METITCGCSRTVKKSGHNQHMKSKIHKTWEKVELGKRIITRSTSLKIRDLEKNINDRKRDEQYFIEELESKLNQFEILINCYKNRDS
jgi:hypothetical protein